MGLERCGGQEHRRPRTLTNKLRHHVRQSVRVTQVVGLIEDGQIPRYG